MSQKPSIDVPHLVKQGEVCRALRCSSTKLGRLVSGDPTFPKPHMIGKQRHWIAADVERWIRAQLGSENQAA